MMRVARARPENGRRRDATGARRRLLAVACTYPAILLVLCAAHAVAPRRSGPLALAGVVAPYLFLPLLAHVPLLSLRGAWPLRILLVACAVLFAGWYGPRLPARGPAHAPDATTVAVFSWNVRFGSGEIAAVRRLIESRPAEIVALQEDYLIWYDRDYATWQRQEGTLMGIYPHQARFHAVGLSILSTYPILARMVIPAYPDLANAPPVLWVRLDIGDGRTLVVATAHPRNPLRGDRGAGLPLGYDTARRDAEIAQVRKAVEPFLHAGERLILMGDFNLTDREPAYRDLVAGMRDAYRVVGTGMGHTWGPFPRSGRIVPLLRIDYLLTGPGVTPVSLTIDCATRNSDHCALRSRMIIR